MESGAARLRRDRPRVRRGGLYPLLRAFATVVERDVAVAAVVGDMLAGRAAVYADLVAYDEVAHHSGPAQPRRPQGAGPARPLDRSDRRTPPATPRGPTGSCCCPTTGRAAARRSRGRTGVGLRELVRAGCGLGRQRAAGPAARRGRGADGRAGGAAAARAGAAVGGGGVRGAALGAGGARVGEPRAGRPSPTSRGGRRWRRWSGAAPNCWRRSPGTRGSGSCSCAAPSGARWCSGRAGHGSWAAGGWSARTRWRPSAAAGRRGGGAHGRVPAHRRPDGQLDVDPGSGAVHAFEEQAGSHGGLGGPQSRPFLLHPGRTPAVPGAARRRGSPFTTSSTPGSPPRRRPRQRGARAGRRLVLLRGSRRGGRQRPGGTAVPIGVSAEWRRVPRRAAGPRLSWRWPWIRIMLPEGSRKAQSRGPQGWSMGSWSTSPPRPAAARTSRRGRPC